MARTWSRARCGVASTWPSCAASRPAGTASRASGGQEAVDPIPEGDAGRSPRRGTLGCVLAALDPERFKGCFADRVDSLREAEPDLVAVDGETSRRTRDRGEGRDPPRLVPARAAPPAPGARAGGRGRRAERDRRHPAAAGAPGT